MGSGVRWMSGFRGQDGSRVGKVLGWSLSYNDKDQDTFMTRQGRNSSHSFAMPKTNLELRNGGNAVRASESPWWRNRIHALRVPLQRRLNARLQTSSPLVGKERSKVRFPKMASVAQRPVGKESSSQFLLSKSTRLFVLLNA